MWASPAEARCWYEGPSWARFKVCNYEGPEGTPIETVTDELRRLDPTTTEGWQQIDQQLNNAATLIQEADKAIACYDNVAQCARETFNPILEQVLPDQLEAIIDRNFGHSTNKFEILEQLRNDNQIVILGSELSYEEYQLAGAAAAGSYVSGSATGIAYMQDLARRQYSTLSRNAQAEFDTYIQRNQQVSENALQDFQQQLSPERLFGMMYAVAMTGEQPNLSFDISVSDTRPTIEVKWVTFGRSERFLSESITLPNTHNIALVINGFPELSASGQSPTSGVDRSGFADSYQTIALAPGFSPDPYGFNTDGRRSGGDYQQTCEGTSGYFDASDLPDFILDWQGQGTFSVAAEAYENSDLMLIVRPEDESFVACNDDWEDSSDPKVTVSNASAIRYGIWVGEYNQSSGGGYRLFVTEYD